MPTPDTGASVKELERTVKEHGFKGAMINGHTNGEFLDDKKYWPIFEAAQGLDVPIYLHPRDPHPAAKIYFAGYEEMATAGWGFTMDTVSHVLRMIFAGLFDAFPKLTLILGHLGEGLPFYLDRLEDHTCLAAKRRGLKKTVAEVMHQNVIVTTSGNFSPLLQKGIGLGYVPSSFAATGTTVAIEIRGKILPAVLVKPPFYKKRKA